MSLLVVGCLLMVSPGQQAPTPSKADSIVILKKDHVMELLTGGKVIRTYKVALGQGGLAPKEREGDAHTGRPLPDRFAQCREFVSQGPPHFLSQRR